MHVRTRAATSSFRVGIGRLDGSAAATAAWGAHLSRGEQPEQMHRPQHRQ